MRRLSKIFRRVLYSYYGRRMSQLEEVVTKAVTSKQSKKASKRVREEDKKEYFQNPFLVFQKKTSGEWFNIYTPMTLPDFEACWEKCNQELLNGEGRFSYFEISTKGKIRASGERDIVYSTIGLVRVPEGVAETDIESYFDKCIIRKAVFKNKD